MKTLLIILVLLSFSSFSQLDTNNIIIGEWILDAYKETSVMVEIESDFISTKKDSIIRLSIKNKTITIFRKGFFKTDTFNFKFSVKPSHYKYGNQVNNLILYPDKKTLKQFRRSYRKQFKELTFSIKKINNSQLVIENHAVDNFPINPFFYQSRKTYSFEKTDIGKDSLEKQFTGAWFTCKSVESLSNIDTISFTKDSCLIDSKLSFETFDVPCKTSFELKVSSKPDGNEWTFAKNENCGIIQRENSSSRNYWLIDPKAKKLILFTSKTKKIVFSYSFRNGDLNLVQR
jgi:hypothetical protein